MSELQTVSYYPQRGNVGDWGDDYGNRVDRFLAGVAYLDGERPSAVFARGYYTRMVVAAWDWRDGELTRRWVFDTDEEEYNNDNWRSQGNHQLSVIDADNDGRHDIVYGSVVIASDGTGKHRSGVDTDLVVGQPGRQISSVLSGHPLNAVRDEVQEYRIFYHSVIMTRRCACNARIAIGVCPHDHMVGF